MKTIFYALLTVSFFILQSSCVGYGVKTTTHPLKNHYGRLNSPTKGWKDMDIYDAIDPSENYEELVRIVVLGDEGDSEEWLLRKLRKEASRYRADALLHISTREVPRTSFNGLALAVNITGIVVGDDTGAMLDMGGDYYTLEVEAVAIRFVDE